MTLHSDIDKLFKNGLEGYSEKAPAFIWDNIDQSLSRRRFKKRRNILYGIAASVALVLSFSAGYLTTFVSSDQVATVMQVVEEAPKVNPTLEPAVENNRPQTVTEPATESIKPIDTQTEPQKTEVEPVEPNDAEGEQAPTNVKKAVSAGVLLPPMFAEQEVYAEAAPVYSTQAETEVVTNEETTLEPLSMIELESKKNNASKTLNYDARLLNHLSNDLDFGYSDAKPVSKTSPWSVGVSASPLVSYRDVYDVSEQSVLASDNLSSLEVQYENEKPLVSYSAGVNVNYNLSGRWNVQSGLYFSEMGQISENIDIYKKGSYSTTPASSYAINTSAGNIKIKGSPNDLIQILNSQTDFKGVNGEIPVDVTGSTDPDLQTDFVQTYEYYELPLVANYKAIDRKLDVRVSGGFSANFMYGSNAYVQNSGKRYNLDAEMENINTISYSGIFGVGMEYPIVERLQFNLQPTLRYSLTPLNSSGTVYPYSFGIYTGLRYNF